MDIIIKKGEGIKVTEDEEVFQIRKDWLVWNFKSQSGHWFNGKRDAMRFLKTNKTVIQLG